jgi:hypothetical protein
MNKKIISNKLEGGLGNRLFMIAMGYCYAKDTDKEYYLIEQFIEPNKHSNTNYFDNIFKNLKVLENAEFDIYELNEPWNKNFSYLNIPNINENILFIGYFQCEKYFLHRKEEILQLFSINENIKIYLQDKYKKLENSIFLHLRLGDMVNHPFHGIDLIPYIKKSLNYIFNLMGKNINIYIMSDDIQLASRKLEQIINTCNYIFINNENDVNTLYLMSLCKLGGICSNSSFSWWGSYLNNNPNKIVIFPNKWVNSDSYEINIYPANSIVIDIISEVRKYLNLKNNCINIILKYLNF